MHARGPKLFLALALCAASLAAQTSVWKVTHGQGTLYLGGTCHVLRPSDFPLPAEFDAAYAAATELVFETEISRIREPATQELLLQQGMYQDGTTLDRVISAEAWAAVEKHCAARGLPAANLRPFKPWMLTLMITVMELQKLGVTDEGVDLHFHRRATTDRKQVSGLEPFDEHIGFITHLGHGQESEMVLNTLNELHEIPEMFGKLVAAWRKGRLDELEELMLREMRERYPGIHAALIVKRNQAWLPRIEAMLATAPVEFVLVGAGHLAGNDGLVAALRARGCTVEQLVVKN